MDDKKKVKAPKKISIKNKKDATKTLAKSTIKGKVSSNKVKLNSAKKTSSAKTEKPKKLTVVVGNNVIEEKKKNNISTPNNIKRKITTDEKTQNKNTVKVKKKDKKDKSKEKHKIEFPKEWKLINSKNKNLKSTGKKTLDQTQGIKSKLKSSIFEEIDENTLKEQKKKQKESMKKTLMICLIVFVLVGVIGIALIKYNDFVKRQLAIYDVYKIGDKVTLEDGSVWYVISDSDSKESTITIISDSIIDINDDDTVDEDDKIQYNSDNKAEYDVENEDGVAYYLSKTYKEELSEDNSGIKEARLLKSREYVKIRERMDYGYEWDEGNWLANTSLSKWWIDSAQNDKVFAVTPNGTYALVSPTSTNYIRPVIEINKESVKKVLEQRKMRVDLINGLNG